MGGLLCRFSILPTRDASEPRVRGRRWGVGRTEGSMRTLGFFSLLLLSPHPELGAGQWQRHLENFIKHIRSESHLVIELTQ